MNKRGRRPLPPGEKKLQISVALSPKLVKELDKQAGESSRSSVVEKLLRAALK